MQWHPIFAKMLRPIVQDHYEVLTDLPVGDAPRSADIVLVRRTSDQPTPFRGLLQHLTTWNIIEFKGRSVSARIRDLDFLVELGLGVDRRLNQELARQRERSLDAAEVSLWYIVNHLGRRFLREARELLGGIEEASPGVWRSQVLRRPLFLVDGRTVPVDRESVAIHLVGEESLPIESMLARVLVEEPGYWEMFGSLLKALHPNIWKEATAMARSKSRDIWDPRPFLEELGLERYLEVVDVGEIIDTVGPKKVAKALGMDRYVASLSPEERKQLKERLKQVHGRGLTSRRELGRADMPRRTICALIAAFVCPPANAAEPPVDFRTDVIAALSRAGCNSGACHGSPNGKNGFRLSLRGFDPDVDLYTLTRAEMGRRVDRLRPENSLFLLKGTGRTAHQGGVRLQPGDPAYQVLVRWVAEGCRDAGPSPVTRLEVLPERLRLSGDSTRQQLTAHAHFANGAVRDVTDLAVFSVNAAGCATVSAGGMVEFQRTGEASILVRYLDRIRSARLTYVRSDPAFVHKAPPPANDIDRHVFAKQKELQLNPAPICSDEVFLRRVFLDTIGVLPTAEEARTFLDAKDSDKRAKLIDRLLERDEYASLWALKWADVLRGSPTTISERGVHSFHRYLVRTMAEDKPMDQFARELLTSLGNTLNKPAANFYRVSRTPEETAENFAQLFLGVRVQCAHCHNHPFESITQTDYFGLAAYFAQVQFKGTKFGLDDEIVYLQPGRELQHPTTRKKQEPIAFGTPAGPLTADDDRRQRLADWLTSPDNRWFAPSIVNRVWYHLLGQGIVSPVDDFRDTNPPSNPELLETLSADFVRNGYRLKPLIRTILNSRTYQLAGTGAPEQSPFAADPDRYFTKAAIRMLPAEQILDAVSAATGVPEKFKGYPLGTRALELAEGGINHPFLQAFSKPVRDVSCECAREEDPSLPQMLHLLNNAGVLQKIKSPQSQLAAGLKDSKETAFLVEHIYLATLSRRPTKAEMEVVNRHIAGLGDRVKGLQDLQYALMNTGEFLLRH